MTCTGTALFPYFLSVQEARMLTTTCNFDIVTASVENPSYIVLCSVDTGTVEMHISHRKVDTVLAYQ